MKVITIRRHINRHGSPPAKNIGQQYDVSDAEGKRLIEIGVVEAVKEAKAPKPAEAAAPSED